MNVQDREKKEVCLTIFVTSNRNKFEEVSEILGRKNIPVTWEELEYDEIQSDSIEEISYDSCFRLRTEIEGNYFLEDTGIHIKSLEGFPGPYSSYVQRTIGNSGILKLVQDRGRDAYFKTVISLYYEGTIFQFTGTLQGKIALEARGERQFGYDPIFVPEGADRTLSEMSIEEKNRISHRGKAVDKMTEFILSKSSR